MALMVPGTSALSSLLEAFVEMSGARGKCDYLDYDYDTIEARRWIAEIKIPASQIVVPIAINYINRNFWTFGRLELSGARGKGDYLDYDYGTAEARRWIEESAEIKISEVGLPRRKRARTS